MKTKESMFSKAVANIVSQIGHRSDDQFIPALLHESDKLVLMKMVYKQSRRWCLGHKYKYKPSDYRLSDILQDKTPLDPDYCSETVFGAYQGTFEHEHCGSMRAKITQMVSARLEGQDSAELLLSPVKVKKETVNVGKLRESKNRCDMQHWFVQKIQNDKKMPKCPYVLAVVTERVVTTNSWEISEARQLSGGAGFTVKNDMMGVVDTIDAKVQNAKQHSITINAGTVIAYGVRELKIKASGDLVFSEPGMPLDYAHGSDLEGDCLFDEDLDLTELQNPEEYLSPLETELPQSTRSALFQRFCELMKDRDALSDVENTLEEWCTGIAPVETEQNASVSHSNSASAILDLLRPTSDSHMESDGPGSPLTAAHLLVSAMEALPDEALSLLSECNPGDLKAFNALLNMLDLKNQKKSCSPLPLESLPLPLQDDKAFHWVEQLLITSNVNLRKEAGGLLAERESDAGVLPLVLCVTVQGLSYLCDQQN